MKFLAQYPGKGMWFVCSKPHNGHHRLILFIGALSSLAEAANHESGSLTRLFLEGMEGIQIVLFGKNIIHSELNQEAFGCKE